MNVENLTILAKGLFKLPKDYEKFEMFEFLSPNPDRQHRRDRLTSTEDYIKNNGNICGSVACAVGHGPSFGITVDLVGQSFYDASELWAFYCKEAFGVEWGSGEAEWMFGAGWGGIDNTPRGAAKRIMYLLQGNSVPEGFSSGYAHEFVHLYE